LLGFDAVVAPIMEALGTPDLDPLSIGVHSPWAGGNSTVLRLLDERLRGDSHYLVINIDPWMFDDHADVRGTLMAEILDHLLVVLDDIEGVRGPSRACSRGSAGVGWSRRWSAAP
jgi:predicted KAP-like P-loop ATPase